MGQINWFWFWVWVWVWVYNLHQIDVYAIQVD